MKNVSKIIFASTLALSAVAPAFAYEGDEDTVLNRNTHISTTRPLTQQIVGKHVRAHRATDFNRHRACRAPAARRLASILILAARAKRPWQKKEAETMQLHCNSANFSYDLRLRRARALPTLRRLDGGTRVVGIRRGRRNPPPLGMRLLRKTLQHLRPAHAGLRLKAKRPPAAAASFCKSA